MKKSNITLTILALLAMHCSIGQGMKVAPNTKVTVETGTSLNVNTGDLQLVDNNSTVPSFLQKGALTFSGGGEAKVEQYLTKDVWHISSLPVNNGTIASYNWMYLYGYHEPDNSWNTLNWPTTMPLDEGKGYFVWAYTNDPSYPPSPDSAVLNGVLNYQDLPVVLSNTDASPKSGWNMLGNPFPCGIDWNGHADWNLNNVGATIYLYDGGVTGNYLSWNYNTGIGLNGKTNGHIAATQGFWARTTDTTGTAASLTLPQSQRLHSNEAFYKSGMKSWDKMLRLKTNGTSGSDETIICFLEETSAGFDNNFDAWHMEGYENAPSLYSKMGNVDYAVNFLPSIENHETVAISFIAKQENNYSISVEGMESFPLETPIWLEDTKDAVFTDLRANPVYNFTGSPDDQINRFVVHFANPLGTNENDIVQNIHIYSYDKTIYVNIPFETVSEIEVFDLMGKMVKNQNAKQGLNKLLTNNPGSCYIVKVISADGIITGKVYVK